MFGNATFEMDSQNELILSNHLFTNVDSSKLETSTLALLIAAICVIVYSFFNMLYVGYYLTSFKEKIIFKAIPHYFKTLSDNQKMDMLDNEQYYRSFGFSLLDDKALKKLRHLAYKLPMDECSHSDKYSDVDNMDDCFDIRSSSNDIGRSTAILTSPMSNTLDVAGGKTSPTERKKIDLTKERKIGHHSSNQGIQSM